MSQHVQHLFIDALEDALSEAQRVDFYTHLERCETCAQEFRALKATFEQTRQTPPPEPPQAYWDSYWQNLQPRLDPPSFSRLKQWLSQRSLEDALRAGLAAAALIILSIGLYFGDLSFRVADVTEPMAQFENFQNTAQDYLERSKILLTSFSNVEINEETRIPNFQQQKELSQQLVAETGPIKQELSTMQQNRALSLVNDLEVVLLQIANMDSAYDTNTLEMIQYSVEQRSILFKLNLQDMETMIKQTSQKGEEI